MPRADTTPSRTTAVPARTGVIAPRESAAVPSPPAAVAVLLIVAIGLALYLPGLNWGLPATVSWSQDTIAGVRTLGAMEGWPDDWKGRYPPWHYLILDTTYRPVLWHWERTAQMSAKAETGKVELSPPHAPKIGLLLLIARAITVLMAVASALGLWSATRVLTGDGTAALASAVAFMIGADYVYFAHLGNVDVPSMCWFCWSLFFFARALRFARWSDCLGLGLFAALAASTKDSVAGVYPGIALVLLAVEVNRVSEGRLSAAVVVQACLRLRWLVGLAAFLLPYLWINGILVNPQGYADRMRYWLDASRDTIVAHEYRHPSQWRLGLAALHHAAGAVGWPMLVAIVAALVYGLRRHTRTTLIVTLPALVYYLLVIAEVGFVYARHLYVPIALLCIPLGLASATLWRRQHRLDDWGGALTCLVLLPSLGYATAVNLEMLNDSRYDAEAWFIERVEPPSGVGALFAAEAARQKAQYLPRVHELGYATYPVVARRESFDQPQPEFLILSSFDYEDFDAGGKTCVAELLAGRLGYAPIVNFRGRYLGTGSSWLSVAGWGAPPVGKISPTVTVFRRTSP